MWNNRPVEDGERTIAGIQAAEGKRLMYKDQLRRSILKNVRKKTAGTTRTILKEALPGPKRTS